MAAGRAGGADRQGVACATRGGRRASGLTQPRAGAHARPMKWVTRPHIRVNRTATAWLIRRFIDPEATFLFVPADRVAEVQRAEGAIGFDAPGATYPHADARGRCSFEALVEERCTGDVALDALARIVRSADFADEVDRVPEAAGLRAISHG